MNRSADQQPWTTSQHYWVAGPARRPVRQVPPDRSPDFDWPAQVKITIYFHGSTADRSGSKMRPGRKHIHIYDLTSLPERVQSTEPPSGGQLPIFSADERTKGSINQYWR